MMRVFDVVGRPATEITKRSSSRATASSCRIAAPSVSSPTVPTRKQRAPSADTLAATLAAPPRAAWRSRTVTTGTGASGLSRSVSPDEVAVEHDVTDHDDAARLHPVDELHQPVAGELGQRRSHRSTPRRLKPSVALSRPSNRFTVRPS